MRQQFVDPAGRVRLHAHEHVGQVVDRVDAEFLARRNEGVEHRVSTRMAQLAFGDNVRVRASPETTERHLAGLIGQIQGVTTPSVTNVDVVGGLAEDCAFAVEIKNKGPAIWFSPDLLELVDHAPGTEITINGVAKKWTRAAGGCWIESSTGAPWWKFW